jgi:hypothetical protein
MDRILTILDTSGIQAYVFGSNRLRENVVASYLVELATKDWLKTALENKAPQRYRLIFYGGGNAAILFQSIDDAKKVVRALSHTLLLEAPGLQLVAAHTLFDYTQQALGGPKGIYAQTAAKIRAASQQRGNVLALPGLGVTRVCRSTGQPAVANDLEEPARPISAETAAKTNRRYRNAADRHLYKYLRKGGLNQQLLRQYVFSRELDDLGRSRGESSYIAVIHADGNGMGQRFQDQIDAYPKPQQNDQFLKAIAQFSQALKDIGSVALQRTLRRMIEALETPAFADLKRSLVKAPNKLPYLPLRPIVFGGDDVTVVCDGRLGLSFAATYLEEFQHAATKLPDKKPGYACAGVAIVKTHYPFARAYGLSSELCDSAKNLVRITAHERQQPTFDATALDWHISASGIAGDLETIRTRQYTNRYGMLIHRPLFRDGLGWEAWDSFAETVATFQKPEWADRQNKVIALREALRSGPDTTRSFLVAYGIDGLPPISGTPGSDYQMSGWYNQTCAYFDAIEALEFYRPLPDTPEAT